MNMHIRDLDGILIIHPDSKRVTATSGVVALDEALQSALADGQLALAIDLESVEYTDNAMIGALVAHFKQLNRNNGRMYLFNVSDHLHEFFRQTVLDQLIHICADESEVRSHFADSPKRRRGSKNLKAVMRDLFKFVGDSERRGGDRRVESNRRLGSRRRQNTEQPPAEKNSDLSA